LHLFLYTSYSHLHYHFRFFFFFNDTSTTEIYTLSLHDALPIFSILSPQFSILSRTDPCGHSHWQAMHQPITGDLISPTAFLSSSDRKSTRLNSSHVEISYAVFCLKKKKKKSKIILK